MKVFTVGLDKKPPQMVEKSESPPPNYADAAGMGANVALPLPMGPEIAPIIVRKSRGYKGILLVMLGVFLMALFALTLSEIAYNRQRDENFFRLQWAQLKHRLGYEYGAEFPHRIVPVNRQSELGEILAQRAGDAEREPSTTTTTEGPRRIFIDNGALPPTSGESSAASSGERDTPEQFVRDARLAFLKSILQKIKQNAEEMGFDGTMQVSVIEVEPQQQGEMLNGKPVKGSFGASEDPRSDAFLDSFGEFHAPSPFGQQSAQIAENSIVDAPPAGRPRGSWPPQEFGFEIPMAPFPQQQQQQLPYRPEMMLGFRGPQEWPQPQRPDEEHWHPSESAAFELHPKSNEFGGASPSQEIMGEIYGRKFGRMLQDLIAARIQNSIMQQQQQQQMMNPMLQMRPSFPIESQQQPQQGWWDAQQPSGAQIQFPPPPPPPVQQPQAAQSNAQPPLPPTSIQQQPEAAAPQQKPAVQQQPEQQQFGQGFPQPSPQFPVFIAPEDRIQIEPPNQMNGASMWNSQPQDAQPADPKAAPHIVDFMPAPRDLKAWTHQSEPAPTHVIDGEVQQPAEEAVGESHDNKLVILKKPPQVDGEKNEEFGAFNGGSQLADLPLKELQGQLAAAAAAALAAQHQHDLEQQQGAPQPAPSAQQSDRQPQSTDDVFKSLEQTIAEEPQQQAAEKNEEEPAAAKGAPERQQQSVEPAPIAAERNDDQSEQVDFPAVKFPGMSASDAVHDGQPMHDLPEQSGIFFQVDEPQQQQQQQPRNVAGFV
ncbi:hypothetical protein M3Y99_00297400 [Aphelenchoides fujianensis]|nr:hypothetical protein M3Y99_00297400 [Aphelenchoides fujianensis]